MPTDAFEARIDRLGSEGDGVCHDAAAPLHVRYALPGETVLAAPLGRNRATTLSVLQPSPDRVPPPCALFGRCGGCVLQHLDPVAGLAWKRDQVLSALRAAGFAPPPAVATAQSPPGRRRRMDLAIRRLHGGALLIGLHERGSDAVIDLVECHVLRPELFALIGALRPVLARLQAVRRSGSLIVNLLRSGPDLLLATDGPLDTPDRSILAGFAAGAGIPRIAWRREEGRDPPEIVSQIAPLEHRFGDAALQPPPGAFLQATAEAEAAIVGAVLDGLPGRLTRGARIVELYAGCGTISVPLADRARVLALEGHAAAAEALRTAGAGRRIEVATRDLNRQPMLARDLAGAAAIVLDPPHAGAGAQMPEIARALAPRVVYVSCNPAALAADAAQLARAGYALVAVTVIDQFLWSARVESVCVFDRTPTVHRGPMPRPAPRPR